MGENLLLFYFLFGLPATLVCELISPNLPVWAMFINPIVCAALAGGIGFYFGGTIGFVAGIVLLLIVGAICGRHLGLL